MAELPARTVRLPRRIHLEPELVFGSNEKFLNLYGLFAIGDFAPDHAALAPTHIGERATRLSRIIEKLIV